MLKGKKILLGVTGSIAAYKSALLVRLLTKAGAEVKVIMTPDAGQFITPLTLSTLSGSPILQHLSENDSWSNHVMLGRWADVFIIAPLSCNTLAKMANGLCDNLLMAVYLSATCKVMVAPAMDEDMWHHGSTKSNISRIQSYGNEVLPVAFGSLASGLTGEGRMAEPEVIVQHIESFLSLKKDLAGKKVLITAGPTYEPIDPVRFIGNHSTGKMGFALAQACIERGAEVTLITGPVSLSDVPGAKMIRVQTAQQMFDAAVGDFDNTDIAILSAAVADFKVNDPATEKIKKKDGLTIELEKNPDILKHLGSIKKHQIVVGFALETQNEASNALTKLKEKNADMIVLNSLKDDGAGFGTDTNKIIIFDKNGGQHNFGLKTKSEVATDILNTIMHYEKN